jgi:hypothetical protein
MSIRKKIIASVSLGLTASLLLVGCTSSGPSPEEAMVGSSESVVTDEGLNGEKENTDPVEATPDPPVHELVKTETGAQHIIKASSTMKNSDLQDLKDIVKLISEEDSLNQPPDPVALYGDKPGLTTLQENRDKYKVIYLETEDGAGLEFISEDPTIIQALHQWVDAGELPSFGSGDLGVYGPSY